MTQYLKVEGNDSLVRDVSTKAIINTSSDYKQYLARREAARKREEEIAKQAEDINNLKQDMADIKSMLMMLINKESS